MSEHEVASTDEKRVRFSNRKQAWKEKQGSWCHLADSRGQ